MDADRLHEAALVWDMVWPLYPPVGNTIDRLGDFHAAGTDVVSITVGSDGHGAARALERIAEARRHVLASPTMRLCLSTDDIEAAKAAGQLAVLMHFSGTRCLDRNLNLIEVFYSLGVRHNLLVFNITNSAGGGCADAVDGGLTRFGRRVIEEMERVGMIVDLSHTGSRTAHDALDAATRPVIFSHSNCSALQPHYRNISDDLIRACAATGGMIGISCASNYLGVQKASGDAIATHIDHVVQLVGIDHAGLGLDIVFDEAALNASFRASPDEWPEVQNPGWQGYNYISPAQSVDVTRSLVRRGYSTADVQKVLGLNWLRVARDTWR